MMVNYVNESNQREEVLSHRGQSLTRRMQLNKCRHADEVPVKRKRVHFRPPLENKERQKKIKLLSEELMSLTSVFAFALWEQH